MKKAEGGLKINEVRLGLESRKLEFKTRKQSPTGTLMGDHAMGREDALWKVQESFGWTASPDVKFEWTQAMLDERIAQDKEKSRKVTTTRKKKKKKKSNNHGSSSSSSHHPRRRPTTAPSNRRQQQQQLSSLQPPPSSSSSSSSLLSNTWKDRLLRIPNSTKKRGLPKGVRRPRPTTGTSVRFLSGQRQLNATDERFVSRNSTFYDASPYSIQAPPISKEVAQPVSVMFF